MNIWRVMKNSTPVRTGCAETACRLLQALLSPALHPQIVTSVAVTIRMSRGSEAAMCMLSEHGRASPAVATVCMRMLGAIWYAAPVAAANAVRGQVTQANCDTGLVQEAIALGACASVVDAMRCHRHIPEVLEAGAACLHDLCTHSGQLQDAAVDAGAVGLVVALMRDSSCASGQRVKAAQCLGVLCSRQRNLGVGVAYGTAPVAVDLLRRHVADPPEFATVCQLLCHLLRDDSSREAAARSGAVPVLIAAQQACATDEGVQLSVCSALQALVEDGAYLESVLAAGGLESTVFFGLRSLRDSAPVQAAACQALQAMAKRRTVDGLDAAAVARHAALSALSDEALQRAASVHAAGSVTSVLGLHRANAAVVEAVNGLLLELFRIDKAVLEAAAAGLGAALAAAADAHPGHGGVQRSSALVVATLARSRSMAAVDQAACCVRGVYAGLAALPNNAAVFCAACTALHAAASAPGLAVRGSVVRLLGAEGAPLRTVAVGAWKFVERPVILTEALRCLAASLIVFSQTGPAYMPMLISQCGLHRLCAVTIEAFALRCIERLSAAAATAAALALQNVMRGGDGDGVGRGRSDVEAESLTHLFPRVRPLGSAGQLSTGALLSGRTHQISCLRAEAVAKAKAEAGGPRPSAGLGASLPMMPSPSPPRVVRLGASLGTPQPAKLSLLAAARLAGAAALQDCLAARRQRRAELMGLGEPPRPAEALGAELGLTVQAARREVEGRWGLQATADGDGTADVRRLPKANSLRRLPPLRSESWAEPVAPAAEEARRFLDSQREALWDSVRGREIDLLATARDCLQLSPYRGPQQPPPAPPPRRALQKRLAAARAAHAARAASLAPPPPSEAEPEGPPTPEGEVELTMQQVQAFAFVGYLRTQHEARGAEAPSAAEITMS